jgi:hypothetical protein
VHDTFLATIVDIFCFHSRKGHSRLGFLLLRKSLRRTLSPPPAALRADVSQHKTIMQRWDLSATKGPFVTKNII